MLCKLLWQCGARSRGAPLVLGCGCSCASTSPCRGARYLMTDLRCGASMAVLWSEGVMVSVREGARWREAGWQGAHATSSVTLCMEGTCGPLSVDVLGPGHAGAREAVGEHRGKRRVAGGWDLVGRERRGNACLQRQCDLSSTFCPPPCALSTCICTAFSCLHVGNSLGTFLFWFKVSFPSISEVL